MINLILLDIITMEFIDFSLNLLSMQKNVKPLNPNFPDHKVKQIEL